MLLTGILFANGRRTVTSWLRAAGVSDDFCDDDYFLARVGHKTHSIATPLVALILRTLSLPDRLLLVITFRATYLPVGGVIRVVLIKEDHGWLAFFCLNGGLVAASKNRHLGRTSDDADRLANRIHDVIYHFGESGRRPLSPKVPNGWELIEILVPRRQYCNPPTALSTPLSALSPALSTQTAPSEFFHPAALFAPRPPWKVKSPPVVATVLLVPSRTRTFPEPAIWTSKSPPLASIVPLLSTVVPLPRSLSI